MVHRVAAAGLQLRPPADGAGALADVGEPPGLAGGGRAGDGQAADAGDHDARRGAAAPLRGARRLDRAVPDGLRDGACVHRRWRVPPGVGADRRGPVGAGPVRVVLGRRRARRATQGGGEGMTPGIQRRTLDVSDLPDYGWDEQSPLWWGNLLLTLVESAYASVVWTTLGLAVTYQLAAAGEFFIMGLWLLFHDLDDKHALDVTLAGGFWYWVAGTGLVLYVIIFWGARFL